MNISTKLKNWLDNVQFLPEFMRDFHDQKDLFKTMHLQYENGQDDEDSHPKVKMPTWMEGQIYVIDWFLFFMATRGYTLQKSRAKLDFVEYKVWTQRDEMMKSLSEAKDSKTEGGKT